MESQNSIFADVMPNHVETPWFRKFTAYMIDFFLQLLIVVASYILIPREIHLTIMEHKPFATYALVLILFSLYRLISILLMDRTVGMAIFRSIYLNEHLQPLSQNDKLIVIFIGAKKRIKQYKATRATT